MWLTTPDGKDMLTPLPDGGANILEEIKTGNYTFLSDSNANFIADHME